MTVKSAHAIFTVLMSSKLVVKFTEGVLSRVTDMTLALIFYGFEISMSGSGSMRSVNHALDNSERILEEINYKTIKRSLKELKRKGLIKTLKRGILEPEITAFGKQRITRLVPKYLKRRPWDGNFYLITYDIPVKFNRDRDTLRKFLKSIGCGLLQESVWFTPYNPATIVREFVEKRDLSRTILVSVLGKEVSIGEMAIEDLLEKVFKLQALNARYEIFLGELKTNGYTKEKAIFLFISILKDDPQLPYKLLPNNWVGDNAYLALQKFLKGSVKLARAKSTVL